MAAAACHPHRTHGPRARRRDRFRSAFTTPASAATARASTPSSSTSFSRCSRRPLSSRCIPGTISGMPIARTTRTAAAGNFATKCRTWSLISRRSISAAPWPISPDHVGGTNRPRSNPRVRLAVRDPGSRVTRCYMRSPVRYDTRSRSVGEPARARMKGAQQAHSKEAPLARIDSPSPAVLCSGQFLGRPSRSR